jgi:hypothetical protein
MNFRKITVASVVSSLLAVLALMGVSPALATEECEIVRLDDADVEEIVARTRVEAEALLDSWAYEFAVVSSQSSSELQLCRTTKAEMLAQLGEEGPTSFIIITRTDNSTADNTCEDPVCGPDNPCPPGESFHHYDEHGNPVCHEGGNGGDSFTSIIITIDTWR